jgi:MFS family permease
MPSVHAQSPHSHVRSHPQAKRLPAQQHDHEQHGHLNTFSTQFHSYTPAGFSTPSNYSIGIGAPVLLTSLRIVQGLALGGEYCVALIYISELAPVDKRGTYVAALMVSVSCGLISATLFVMALNAALSAGQQVSRVRWAGPPALPAMHACSSVAVATFGHLCAAR